MLIYVGPGKKLLRDLKHRLYFYETLVISFSLLSLFNFLSPSNRKTRSLGIFRKSTKKKKKKNQKNQPEKSVKGVITIDFQNYLRTFDSSCIKSLQPTCRVNVVEVATMYMYIYTLYMYVCTYKDLSIHYTSA